MTEALPKFHANFNIFLLRLFIIRRPTRNISAFARILCRFSFYPLLFFVYCAAFRHDHSAAVFQLTCAGD